MKALHAWTLIATIVTIHEITCPEGQLLSNGIDRAIDRYPAATTTAVLITAGHLLNLMDGPVLKWVDPYKLLARVKIQQRPHHPHTC